MKRLVFLFFSISLILMLTSCGSQVSVNNTSENNISNLLPEETMIESVEFEDSCENPIGASHYPYVTIFPDNGNIGIVSITTAEHGSRFDGFFNGFGVYIGTGILQSKKCYSTAEKANANPIEINSRGHEIIITMSYGNNIESFTMNAGDSQLLSLQERSYLTNRAYVYVIVT